MKILIIGTSPNQPTGYGTVVKYLAEGLIKRKYNVKVFGLQTRGIPANNYELPFQDSYDVLDWYIKQFEITHLITVCDIHLPMFANIPNIVKANKLKWIHHVTAQNAPLSKIIKDQLVHPDILVSPSAFVSKLLEAEKFDNTIIPHAFIMPKIQGDVTKSEVLKNKFVYIVVASNQIQKNIVTVLKAFKIVKDNYKDVVLICVTDPAATAGIDLLMCCSMLGLVVGNDVIFPLGKYRSMLSSNELVILYKMSDVYVSASMGESFSLPLLEASYYGLPAIVPDFSAPADFVKKFKCGITVHLKLMQTNYSLSEQALVSAEDLAVAMIRMYSDKQFRELTIENIKNRIEACKEFELDNVLNQWEDILKK